MCGIAGILRWGQAPPAQAEVDAMCDALAHRGPDGRGVFIRDGVALGHRRLSIIDLATGQQPMCNEDETVWITFNGEIYNFKELRDELRNAGHRFKSNSDTEVIVHAYEQWGDDCVLRLRGMFAFVIADFRRRRFFLARDHFGIKPLYYRRGAEFFAFGSELAAVLKAEAPPPTGSLRSVDLFFRFGYIPQPDTIYRDVFKLPPAHRMSIEFDGTMSAPTRYWSMDFKPDADAADGEWDEAFRNALRESVGAHLVSDVPFGVFLSGGIDSTLVAWQMSELLDRPVKAFSIGFDEQQYSELKYAKQAADELGIELHHEVVRQNAVELLPNLISHYGEPFGDSSSIPTWHVCKLARAHVPMVLSGDGGDEFFAGYPRYHYFANRSVGSLLINMFRCGSDWPLVVRLLGSRGLGGFASPLDAWLALMNYMPALIRRSLWRPAYRHLLDQRCNTFADAASHARQYDQTTFGQSVDIQTYLPDDILTKVDVASMYHGLEVRTPLIDLRIAALASRLPLNQRIRREPGRGLMLKSLPKRALLKRFPPEFVHRSKMGFGIPRDQWFAKGGAFRALFDEVIADRSLPMCEWFDQKTIRRLLHIHDLTGRFSTPLWPLLVLGVWQNQQRGISFS